MSHDQDIEIEAKTENPAPAAEAAEAPKAEPKPSAAVAPAAVAVVGGLFAPKDNRELARTCNAIATGGGFPERFKTMEQRLAAYNLAASLMGAQWQTALNNIAVIKGQMSIYGELPGTLAERTGEVAEKEVYIINKDYVKICVENKNLDDGVFAGVCRIQRKGRVVKEFFYTITEAISAGQYPPKKRDGSPNPDSPWEKHTKVMLMRKAMNQAVKFEFPESLVGVPLAEYDFDEMPDARDVTPAPSGIRQDRADDLNTRFNQPHKH